MFGKSLRTWLKEPETRSLDIDGVDVTVAHRQVLLKKRMLRDLFANFYHECRKWDERFFAGTQGKRLEVGAGSSIMKEFYPDVLTSDIKPLPFVDLVAPGESLPFPDGTLRAIYGINVFHHFPDPAAFLNEAMRVLTPGGGVVLIEPYYGLFASWLFPRLHESEGFDPEMPDWVNHEQSGPCSRVNQALSYIVFRRDRARFQQQFPHLELLLDRPHTHLRYLLSGGVNFRQLLPERLSFLAGWAEAAVSPLNRWLSLQHTVVLRKTLAASCRVAA